MNAGELFINLGVTGTEKTVGELTNVNKGMGNVASTSLQAKAAIVAALYALEHFAAKSGQTAIDLQNLSRLTGVTMKDIQQWEYATKIAGGSAEEFQESLHGLADVMGDLKLNKGPPELLGLFSAAMGSAGKSLDIERVKNDMKYTMQKLQEAAQVVDPLIFEKIAKSFHLTQGVSNAMLSNTYRPEILNKAPTLNDNQLKNLVAARKSMVEAESKIQNTYESWFAKHGQQLTKDMGELVTKTLKLVGALDVLADKLGIFNIIKEGVEGWGMLAELVAGGVDKLTGGKPSKNKRSGDFMERGADWLSDKMTGFDKIHKGEKNAKTEVNLNQNIQVSSDVKDPETIKHLHRAGGKALQDQITKDFQTRSGKMTGN